MSKSAPQGNHRAVVLGGGGSKGAYQIGVWQALRELGLDYQVVTGTSVGALNGALMAQGEFEAAYALWWEMDNARVMEGIPSAGDTLDSRLAVYRAFVREMVTKGGLDISPLEATIRDILDEEKLRQSGVEYGIVTVDMSTLKPVELFLRDMPPGSVADYMIASASCFPAFKPRTIEKARFIDGGYYDNLPVGMATRAGVALSEIWAVDVDGIGVKRSFRPEVPLHTVRSCWDLGNFLIFEKDQCRRNIRLGYLDAMKEAGRYDGRAYAFPAGEGDVFRRARGPAMAELTRRVLEPLEEPARAAVEALALARVRGKLRRRRLGEDLLLAAAETAGELLGLDPTRVYTMAELDDALRERVRLERDRQGGQELTLDTLPGEGGSLAEALAALGKELALLSVLENLAQYLAGEAPILRPGLLAAALPREFLACLYLIVAL
jgi:NTE family protein